MTTLTLTGIIIERDINDDPVSIAPATFSAAFPDTTSVINYSVLPTPPDDILPLVDIGGTPVASASVNGFDIGASETIENSIGFIQTAAGTHIILGFYDPDTNTDALFQIGGDPLTLPTTVAELAALEASIINTGQATGAFAPGVDIPINTLGGTLSGDTFNLVPGADGDDSLVGTAGDDLIVTGNATPDGDLVVGSSGNDTIDMSGNDGVNGFVVLSYDGLDAPISVDIDGGANTGSIDKAANGTDTLLGVEQPLFAGWTNGGLDIRGTDFNDSFTLSPEGQQWMSVRASDGTDSFTINGTGLVRLDFRDGTGINVNLATGTIADDGFGNAETIGGTGDVWEVFGTVGNDTFTGSAADESFRSIGGNNTLDGGLGFDRLRYDSFEIASVNIDADAGTASGTLNGGGSFTDTISGFERLRGSNGNDQITGEATVNNRLEGRGGTDTFTHVGGNDTISDFDAATETLIVRVAGLDQTAVDAAVAAATDTAGGAQVSFGSGTVTFSGLTTADLAGADVQFAAPGGANLVPGTDGDDSLVGTAGDDLIVTGNATPDGDLVVGSSGNDTIDMSGNDGVNGFVTLSYDGFADGILVDIDGAANTGIVIKNDGDDTLLDVANPLDAGFGNGGLGIIGTANADQFDVAPDAGQWMQMRGGDGTDGYTIGGTGLVRLDFAFTGAAGGAQINLATGTIADDGFGNAEMIGGTNSVWEVRGTENADVITGGAADESFISQGGNDTIDGGDGFDRLRYDRSGVTGVTVDLAAGTATGTWDGAAFTDTISNIEFVRGSNSGDTLAGDTGNNRLEGRGGTDTFTHVGGNDTIGDFDAASETLIVRIAGSSFLALQAALANATDTAGGAVVDFGGGNTLTFAGLTAAQVARITADTGGPTEGADTLIGTAGDDVISGLGGNDLIEGGDGADDLFGGDGNDTLDGGTGPNGLFGGAGDDSLTGGIGWEEIFGGAGNDTLSGDAGNDNIGGGTGLDLIFAGDGEDIVFGGDDDDTIWGGLGDDQIGGSNGADRILAGPGNDEAWGGAGNDLIDGSDGNDSLSGSDGNDTIDGGGDADELWGGLDNDSLLGGDGNDTLGGFDGDDFLGGGIGADELWGAEGNDTLEGGDGADQIGGANGADSIDGGAGNDTVFAGDGNDTILGGSADDLIYGGAGNDRLGGGAGNDTVWGGPGVDVFEFDAGGGADVFEFFSVGAGDRIEIDSALTGGAADGAAVVAAFGAIVEGNAVLDFGVGNSITLTGVTTLDGLDTVLDIV